MSEETLLKEQGKVLSSEEALEAGINNRAKLLSDPYWNDVLQRYLDYVAGDEDGLPRFGSLSILCSKTPFFVYDHPALLEQCRTAFATETMVGFSKDFFIGMVESELIATKENRNEMSVAPLVLHELSHIMRGHHGRMLQFPNNIANIAQDISINQMIIMVLAERNISAGPVFATGWGSTQTEFNLFYGQSEEVIGQQLLSIAKSTNSNQSPSSQGSDDSGESNSGETKSSDQESSNNSSEDNKSSENQNEQDSNEQPSNSDTKQDDSQPASHGDGKPGSHKRRTDDMSIKTLGELLNDEKGMDKHNISDQSLSKVLEDNNLDHIKDALNLPDSCNSDAFKARNEAQRARNQDSVATSKAIRNQHSQATGRPAAGSHIDDAHDDVLNKGRAPEISWKANLSNTVKPIDGFHEHYTDDFSADTATVLGLHGMEAHVGDSFPLQREKGVAAFLLDTSGSMQEQFQSDLLDVAYEGLTPPHDSAGFETIYFGSADTSSRKDLIRIDYEEREMMDKMSISGFGGTDFITPIHEIVDFAEDEDFRLDVIVYMTDMGATIPSRDQLPENTPPIVFVTTEHNLKALNAHELARVHELGAVIEITSSEYKAVAQDVDIEELENQIEPRMNR